MKAPRALSALVLLVIAAAPRPAGASSARECIEAFDRAQDLRESLHLRAAREQLLVCANESCPAPVRKDCADLGDVVTRDMPTLSLGARDASGVDLTGVRVLVDGEAMMVDDSGRAIPSDPGRRHLRFEYPGYVPVQEDVVLRVGEHSRQVIATFSERAAPPPAAGSTLESVPAPMRREKKSGAPAAALALGAVGAVGLASFAFFGLTGLNERSSAVSACAPACTTDQVSPVRTRFILADVSLGVSLVALGIATYVWLTSR